MTENVRRNFVSKNKFFVKYDEFLEDNLLNQILKISRLTDPNIASILTISRCFKECSFLLSDIKLRVIQLNHFEKVHLSRLNERYAPILSLCKLFIGQSSVELRPI